MLTPGAGRPREQEGQPRASSDGHARAAPWHRPCQPGGRPRSTSQLAGPSPRAIPQCHPAVPSRRAISQGNDSPTSRSPRRTGHTFVSPLRPRRARHRTCSRRVAPSAWRHAAPGPPGGPPREQRTTVQRFRNTEIYCFIDIALCCSVASQCDRPPLASGSRPRSSLRCSASPTPEAVPPRRRLSPCSAAPVASGIRPTPPHHAARPNAAPGTPRRAPRGPKSAHGRSELLPVARRASGPRCARKGVQWRLVDSFFSASRPFRGLGRTPIPPRPTTARFPGIPAGDITGDTAHRPQGAGGEHSPRSPTSGQRSQSGASQHHRPSRIAPEPPPSNTAQQHRRQAHRPSPRPSPRATPRDGCALCAHGR